MKKSLKKNLFNKSALFHYDTTEANVKVVVAIDKLEIEGRSLFIFGPENKIRIFANLFINHPFFERVILALILISTVTLAFDSPMVDPSGT